MKSHLVAVAATIVALARNANAQTATKMGPNGKPLTVKMDGKYSTCINEGKRMGYSADAAKRYCDGRRGLTR